MSQDKEIENLESGSRGSVEVDQVALDKLLNELEESIKSNPQSKENSKTTELGGESRKATDSVENKKSTEVRSQSRKAAASEEKQPDNRPFSEKYPKLKAIKDWFLDSQYPSALYLFHKGWPQGRDRKDIGLKQTLFSIFKVAYLVGIGLEGYDPATSKLTCADGKVVDFLPHMLSLKTALLTFFFPAMRPETVVTQTIGQGERAYNIHIPQFSFAQWLRNMIGMSKNPIVETLEGNRVDGEGSIHLRKEQMSTIEKNAIIKVQISEEENKILTQRRWTEKKNFNLIRAILLAPFFIIFNLVTWPFKVVGNVLKMGTEVFLPILSGILLWVVNWGKWSTEQLVNVLKDEWGKKAKALAFFGTIIIGGLTLALGVAQFAVSVACQIGLAFTSPLTSALIAYKRGLLILGPKNTGHGFSKFWGVMGFVFSMAVSATLWTIALPLALGALVAAVPALLTPFNFLAQSPVIANALAWFAQLPFVMTLNAAFGTAFGVVGATLTTTFGPAITYLATLLSVSIPQAVLSLGITVGVVVVPALTLVTWGVKELSNAMMRWIEERPVHTLFAKIGAGINAAVNAMVHGIIAAATSVGNKMRNVGKDEDTGPELNDQQHEKLLEDKERHGSTGRHSRNLPDEERVVDEDQAAQLDLMDRHIAELEAGHSESPVSNKAAPSKDAPKVVYVYQNPETQELIVSKKAQKLAVYKKVGDEYVQEALEGIRIFNRNDAETVWKRANSDRSFTQKAVLIKNLDVDGDQDVTVIATVG